MKRSTVWFCVGALAFGGCESLDTFDVDLKSIDPLPRLEQLDYTKVSPAGSPQYWELRMGFGPGSGADRVLASGGPRRRSELAQAAIAALDSIKPTTGWGTGCLPGNCYKYIAAFDTQARLYNSRDALRTFLGSIETKEEAALIVDSHGFYWQENGRNTGFRETSEGWEFVVLQLVRDCAPVQTDRVLVLVKRDGLIAERDREIFEKNQNMCI
jgi:hypothetical protein